MKLIAELVKLADAFDKKGLQAEADYIDRLIQTASKKKASEEMCSCKPRPSGWLPPAQKGVCPQCDKKRE